MEGTSSIVGSIKKIEHTTKEIFPRDISRELRCILAKGTDIGGSVRSDDTWLDCVGF
jgi:hypothetical protein